MESFEFSQFQSGERAMQARLKLPQAAQVEYGEQVVPALYLEVSHYKGYGPGVYVAKVGRQSVGPVFTSESYMLLAGHGSDGNPFPAPTKVPAPRYSAKKLNELFEAELEKFLNSPFLAEGLEWAKGAVKASA